MNSEQSDVSIKHLLKQVYAAHISKVKGLDEEIEELKNKLLEADRKVKLGTDCKRCVELEEAFKTCKAALDEQSKWFENFGQKFSVFNSSENKTLCKDARSLSLDVKDAEVSSNPQLSNAVKKSIPNGQNIFKNLMSLDSDKYEDSLNLCSVPFPQLLAHDYSTLNSDSLILAPDTVDVSDAAFKHSERNKKGAFEYSRTTKAKKVNERNSKEFSDESMNTSGNVIECKEGNTQNKKRTLTESSDCNKKGSKRFSKDNVADLSVTKSVTKHVSDVKNLDPQSQMNQEKATESNSEVATNAIVKNVKEMNSTNPQNLNDTLVKKADNTVNEISNNKKKNQTIPTSIENFKDASVDQVDDFNAKQIFSHTIDEPNLSSKDNEYQVSPSLLHLNKISKPVIDEQGCTPEDINDFQSPILNKKQVKDDGTWAACDKKKLKKKQPVKILKSLSRFKMHLDSLPPNYKKPTYRQTKLSQSIFQPKVSVPSTKTVAVLRDNNSSSSSEDNYHTPVQSINKTGVDFDATCIPDNYIIIPFGSINKEKVSNENFDDSIECVDVFGINDSLPTSPKCKNILKRSTKKSDSKYKAVLEDFISSKKEAVNNENLNSFDRLPKKEEPNYKYKEEAVRKKVERKQLNGFDCKECENYYSELGLSDKEKQERLKKCSRHRAKYAPPPTPEHFWELEFPDTQECKARGYLNETQKVKLKSRRRRPLDL